MLALLRRAAKMERVFFTFAFNFFGRRAIPETVLKLVRGFLKGWGVKFRFFSVTSAFGLRYNQDAKYDFNLRLINQDIKYNFMADLTGTGDRSEYEKICETVFYIVYYVDTDEEVFYTCVR